MEKGFSKKPSRIISPDFYQLVIFGTTGAVNALKHIFLLDIMPVKIFFRKFWIILMLKKLAVKALP